MKTFHDLEYENRLNCLLDNNVGGVDRLRKRKIFINNLNNNIMKCMMTDVCDKISEKLSVLKDIPLLLMRLVLAYGFYGPGMMKWGNIDGIISWFGEMGIPLPGLNAYLAASTEVGGAFLLLIGFGTRLISIPLMVVMLVAIFAVHLPNGFESGNNGFEIPVYYLIMLFTLLIYGGGNISLYGLIKKRTGK